MRSSDWFLKYRHDVTSQHGEDGIIEAIFMILPPLNKWCVEFGASDGKYLSNTYNLIKNKQWHSIQIESKANKYAKLVQTYEEDSVLCINKTVGLESPNTLEELLNTCNLAHNFDFLSIDVDGIDYQIWKSLVGYQPRVICIECCPTCRAWEVHIHGNCPGHVGSSLVAITALGKAKNYELIGTVGVNAFFVLKALYLAFEIVDNNVSNYKIWAANDK